MKRRDFMKSAAALTATAGAGSLAAPLAHADIPALNATVRRITGDAPLSARRVKLDLPVLADNGNSVPLSVSVQSPMSEADHVKAIHLVSERNPEPHMASLRTQKSCTAIAWRRAISLSANAVAALVAYR